MRVPQGARGEGNGIVFSAARISLGTSSTNNREVTQGGYTGKWCRRDGIDLCIGCIIGVVTLDTSRDLGVKGLPWTQINRFAHLLQYWCQGGTLDTDHSIRTFVAILVSRGYLGHRSIDFIDFCKTERDNFVRFD